jgi:RimJ/RimL family protein N-acetyltransferase
MREVDGVRLVSWAEADVVLLHQCNSAEMMAYLGGPVAPSAIERRHQSYLDLPWSGKGAMYRVELGDGESAGSVGHWLTDWRGEIVWETGWMVLPGFQGRGVATAAARAIVGLLRETGGPRYLHAYPVVANAASNAVCRSAGFESRGECDFEYPPGTRIRCHDWRVDLDELASEKDDAD